MVLTLVSYVEITSHTADVTVNFFLCGVVCTSMGLRVRPGTTATFFCLPKDKNNMTQLRTTSLGYFDRQGLLQNVPQKVRLAMAVEVKSQLVSLSTERRVEEIYFVEAKPQATDTIHVREVESNATLTNYAIAHLFAIA